MPSSAVCLLRRGVARTARELLLLSVTSLACAQVPASAAPGIYTCVDAQGRTLSADRPIQACRDREQRVLSPSGSVQSRIGPALSPQQRAEAEARLKAEQEERARLNEEKRRDRALLNRYPNQSAHDKERADALRQISAVKETVLSRLKALREQQASLEKESEFYAKDPATAPPALRRRGSELAHNLAIQGRFLADQDAEIRRINTRFDEELVRLKLLWEPPASTVSGATQKQH